MNKKPACLIVDPFVSPHTLCEALKNQRIAPIVLLVDTWTDPNWIANRIKGLQVEKTIECFSAEQIDNLPSQLQEYDVVGFIYGREGPSIAKADAIARKFFPQYANPGDSTLRTDKYEMQEACRRAGLKATKQILIHAEQDIFVQQEFINRLLPAIVKPLHSSGSIGVTACKTFAEVQQAVSVLMGQKIVAGEVKEILIQEQLMGTEYYIDTVSLHGQHTVCDIFRYDKLFCNNSFIYHSQELIDHETKEAQLCIEYVTRALDAVQLQHGLAHTEVFLTESGPCLIEINPRISGGYGIVNKLVKYAYSTNQAEIFAKGLAGEISPVTKLSGCAMILDLQNWIPRTIGKFDEAALKKFSSYQEHIVLKTEGTYLGQPQSLLDTVASILLWGPSRDQVYQDAEEIFSLEKSGKLF